MISPEVLRRYPYFASIDDESLKAVAVIADEKSISAGTRIFHEADPADTLNIVVQGEVEIQYILGSGEHRTVDTLVEGDILGWSALIEPYKYTAVGTAKKGHPAGGHRCAQAAGFVRQGHAVGLPVGDPDCQAAGAPTGRSASPVGSDRLSRDRYFAAFCWIGGDGSRMREGTSGASTVMSSGRCVLSTSFLTGILAVCTWGCAEVTRGASGSVSRARSFFAWPQPRLATRTRSIAAKRAETRRVVFIAISLRQRLCPPRLVRVALNWSVRGGVHLRFRKRNARYTYAECAPSYRIVAARKTPY